MSLTIPPARIVEESDSPLLAAHESWPRRPLGEVATILNGYAFKSRQFATDGGMPLIRIRDLFQDHTAVRFIGDYDECHVVHAGALLVGMDGDFNCARWRGPDALLNQRVCKIEPNRDRLNLDFLTYLLPGYLQAIHDVTSSTTVTHLSSRDIAQIPIPVPPIEQQQQMSAVLGAISSKRRSALSRAKTVARATEHFRQAVLVAACSGRLTADWRQSVDLERAEIAFHRRRESERRRLGAKYRDPFQPDSRKLPGIPKEWTWAALPELGELGRGKSRHRPRNDPKLYGGEYPFVQTGDVARSRGLITTHTQSYNAAGLAQSRLWPARTVCITIAANIADSGLLTYPACFPDSVVGLVVDENVALPEYVELFVQTARSDLATFAPATAQANINLAILSEVAVALPPIEEQREIVDRVRQLYGKCDAIEAAVGTAAKRVRTSSQAVLAKAFRGELIS